MYCFSCGSRLSEVDYCTACGADVGQYKKIMYAANRLYNDGLERAGVRDLTGAISSLKQCLRFNRKHVEALNLLGLVYYEIGETVEALSAWILSQNVQPEKNLANEYIDSINNNQTRIDSINSIIKKYNKGLELCLQGADDMAVLQLKKVINMSPNYVSARKLLALTYIRRCEWQKAIRELEKAQKIDNGDIDIKRYLKEAEMMLHPGDDKNGKGVTKSEGPTAIYSTSGNEIIIQPVNDRDPVGMRGFLQIAIGLIIGVCIAAFVYTPARVASTRSEYDITIAGYGEQLDSKNTEIDGLSTRIEQLEQTNLSLQTDVDRIAGGNEGVSANNNLIAAALAYIEGGQNNNMSVENYLNNIDEAYVNESASDEFKRLREYLLAQIGGSAAGTYFEAGVEAYNGNDFSMAINNLQKAYQYDTTNAEALYYLGLSYFGSGDMSSATNSFQELINVFPDTPYADKARQKLQEISE